MADYTTAEAIRVNMPSSPLTASTDYDVAIGSFITSASRLIDKEVGMWDNYFYPTTDDETRYYDGSGELEQLIDPCVSLTSVSVAESGGTASSDYTAWTEGTDFYAWPYNSSALSRPIRRLVVDWNGSKARWIGFRKAIKVTGIFGYSATVPADVAQACMIQAWRWFARAKQGYQDAGAAPELGQLFYTRLDPDVVQILNQYKLDAIA